MVIDGTAKNRASTNAGHLQQRIGAGRVQLAGEDPSIKYAVSTGVLDDRRYRQTYTAGLLPDEKAGVTIALSEQEAGVEKPQGIQPPRPLRPQPTENAPGWPVQLAVTAALALVAFVALAVAIRRRPPRGD